MHRVIYLLFLSIFISCATNGVVNADGKNVVLDSTYTGNSLDSVFAPYKESMEAEMNIVLGQASEDLTKYAPESPLGNLVTDIVFAEGLEYMSRTKALGPNLNYTMCLLNFGGLRSTVSKGNVTRGNIYSLMPFDNTIVVVELAPTAVKEMLQYIFDAGGQPISGSKIRMSSNEQLLFFSNESYSFDQSIYVITSDYLAGGGDKMTFFTQAEKKYDSGILIRDAILNHVSETKEFNYTGELDRIQIVR